mmetsp:Transcript_10754/g.10875  ORF Transcript_10754/g.10875 Transcript_10754/m.10875 type:complete len:97 (+) Transcript_10754:3-293(+)
MDLVTSTMRSIKLPEKMQDEIQKYFQYINETPDIQQDLDKFFSLLSPSLKNEILYHIHSAVIESLDVLQDCEDIEVSYIVNNLNTTLYLPNDIIVR